MWTISAIKCNAKVSQQACMSFLPLTQMFTIRISKMDQPELLPTSISHSWIFSYCRQERIYSVFEPQPWWFSFSYYMLYLFSSVFLKKRILSRETEKKTFSPLFQQAFPACDAVVTHGAIHLKWRLRQVKRENFKRWMMLIALKSDEYQPQGYLAVRGSLLEG